MNQHENLTTKLSICKKVQGMLDTDGWKNVIAPRINAMIAEYAGGIRDGQHTPGLIGTSETSENMLKRVGIREGMVRVYNMIMCHPRDEANIVEQLRIMQQNQEKGYRQPMEGGPYDPDE